LESEVKMFNQKSSYQ